uniref:SOWAHA-C winged helix-turn-helix domain-containing protein n=1 Tax=Oreochromis aureus TaxID=47969 RepID=A0A668S374_OREAU
MASEFTQDAVLVFLQSRGGTVKNSDLVLHFRNFIRDHADQDRNRELFKKFVNSVATVKQLDGVSHVILRKKFRGYVSGSGAEVGSSDPPWVPVGKDAETAASNKPRQKPQQKEATAPAPSGETSLVPLEPREHIWLVKAAAGNWPEIYTLFREEPSLLNKKDFISGFTVLHWVAKHGDHRVLNTLGFNSGRYGIEKLSLTFDVNARSNSGHTPLHIAVMHGHKNIIRLLIKKFQANVKQRDMAGKRPWQYLSLDAPLEMFHLLAAPMQDVMTGKKGVEKANTSWEEQQKQSRRLRHHASSASGESPLTIASRTKVKRSTSLAAFLKHKSLIRFQGHQVDSSA